MPVLTILTGTSGQSVHRWRGDVCSIGRAGGNDLLLEEGAISAYHAKIERRQQGFWLVDLNSTNGSFINGQRIKESIIRHGDLLQIGEGVRLRFELEPADLESPSPPSLEAAPSLPPLSPQPSPPPPRGPMGLQPVGMSTGLAPQGTQCPACQTFIPFAVNFCPRCGFGVGQTNLPAAPFQPQYGGFVRPMEPPGAGVGVLPLVALLCGISVIGFPLAIILGLVALAQMRRQGGFSSDRRQALWGVALGVFWAVAFAVAGGWYGTHRYLTGHANDIAKLIAENEASALTDLKGIARAQRLAHVIRFQDPQRTGRGRYLTLEELAQLDTTLFNRDLARGRRHGYRFTVREPTEQGFLATAEPETYNVTGKRTFAVDATGLLRGQDLEGQSYAQYNQPLAVLTDVKSAFDGMDNAIAFEAIAYAKRLAQEGQYEESRQILDVIPEQFAMTTATQELLALKKSVDPFIIEAQASSRWQKAQTAADEGDLKLAIGLLREIKDLYPGYVKIAAVTEELSRLETALAQQMDKEAQALFDQAEALDRAGQPQQALDLYVQIEKNYPDTDWAKRMATARPALQQSIREKSAEQLFATARDLSPTTDYRAIVNNIDLLRRNYADTEYVTRNEEMIQTVYAKALAQQYRSLAVEQMAAGRDADALARLDEAAGKNPYLRPALRDLFLKLYLRVGQKRLEDGDQREALTLFRNYLALEPEQSEVSPTVLGQLHYAVAKSEFALGNYPASLQNLIAARAMFDKDGDYNDLYGTVQVLLGNYEDALPFFDRAIAAKPTAGNFHARRGYAKVLLALYIEQAAVDAFMKLLYTPDLLLPETLLAPSTETNIAADGTSAAAPPTTNDLTGSVPLFATTLPLPVTGQAPDLRFRYDALMSQQLLDELLDLLQQIQETDTSQQAGGSATRSTATARRSTRGSTSSGSGTTGPATNNVQDTRQASIRDRMARVRTGVDMANALSMVHQRVLEHNNRRARAVQLMRAMSALLTEGNRDLARAIQLSADRAADLAEILKATREHEVRLAAAVPRITSYLETGIETINQAYQITENLYRNVRMYRLTSPADPSTTLEVYITRILDRRQFDEGIQSLREAAEIKVPLELYTIAPAGAAATTTLRSAAPAPARAAEPLPVMTDP